VPVRLYSAVARRGISLREIRASDGARIRHRRVAEGTDEEVPYEKIQKAFEITSGNYVPITRDEMAALAPKKSRAIEVQDFVDLAEIDPIYFDSPYYLGPAEGAEKAYSLLARAMEESGKVAIARFVFRNKEHLAALRSDGGVLTLTTMRFADEVVAPKQALEDVLPAESPRVSKKEVEMAEKLIDSLTSPFDPASYRDEYREELMGLIERKAEGKQVVTPAAAEPEATRAPDLMAALEESIAEVKAKETGRGARKQAKKRRTAPKKAAPRKRAKAKTSK
jgi:DNA end-binding protein Ku